MVCELNLDHIQIKHMIQKKKKCIQVVQNVTFNVSTYV